MRIITVSAHYPPNFTSGATIVTDRIARQLQARGHDVRVFSGWTGPGRSVLSSWREEITGLPIQWVVTSPWTVWKERKNYNNPALTDLFSGFLDRTEPDVVHFHTLQSLGVGLVHAASDRDIPTVVTMHDFWWWCPRQFLCDRRYRPCCPVVEAGTCDCEAGRRELELRGTTMRPALRLVDRIVAVSEISARVAVANGADPDRMVVVENGIPTSHVEPRREGSPSPTVRFIYAGGPDRMKGPHVLAESIRMLRELGGWSLDCYGCDVWRNRLASSAVRILPAFDHAELDAVLTNADVLVLPSVARESYSILAREALARGVPVVSSDCLGPEEVVRHGENGMIVPSGDPAALARAMRDLVEQPEMLTSIKAGCHGLPLPSELAQLDRIEQIYGELLADPHRGRRQPAMSMRRVLFVVGIDGAPLRYRAWLPAEGLRSLGVHVDVLNYRHPEVARLGAQADAVVLYRVPATVQILEFIAGLRSSGIRTIFDVDDLIFVTELADRSAAVGTLSREESDLWHEGVRRYRLTMQHCDAFFGSTPELVRHAEDAGLPGSVFPNGIGTLIAQASDRALARTRRRGPLRLGYLSGTKTHQADWRMVEPVIAKVLDGAPEAELWLVGLIEPTELLDPYRERIVRHPFTPWWKLPDVLRDLDVHLAPLVLDDPFNESKSAIKWLEAALVCTPTVASPTRPFAEVIRSGQNGYLAATDDEWVHAIQMLLNSPDLRLRVGAKARRDALLEFAPALQARRYLRLLEDVRVRVDAPSECEVHPPDEASRMIKLDPYTLPRSGFVGRFRADAGLRLRQSEKFNRAGEAAREARRTLVEGGPNALLARTFRMARRILSPRRKGS